MFIFIIQHGEALPSDIDPERPLSEKGIAQVKRMSEFLRKIPVYPDLILHSNKRRAIETAEAVSLTLGGIKMERREYLNPNDSTDSIIEELNRSDKNMMIVGHMPFLNELALRLLNPDSERNIFEIRYASPLIIERTENGYILDTYIRNRYIK
jgi:phosphohistidine phosphatase